MSDCLHFVRMTLADGPDTAQATYSQPGVKDEGLGENLNSSFEF